MRLLLALGMLAMLLSGCDRHPEKIRLQMKFAAGRQLVYDLNSEQTITINYAEPVSETSRSQGEMIQKVTVVLPDSSARIAETSSWNFSELGENGTVEVVSRTESLSYRIQPSGRISEFEILAEDDAARWQEYAQSKLEQSQPTFPDQPVAVGYTWMQTVKIFMPTGEMLDASTTYRFSELIEVDSRQCAVIDYEGNLVLPFDVMESDSLIRKGVDKVDLTGTIWFDYVNGYVFSQHEVTRVTAERAKILPQKAKVYTAYIEGELFFNLKSETIE